MPQGVSWQPAGLLDQSRALSQPLHVLEQDRRYRIELFYGDRVMSAWCLTRGNSRYHECFPGVSCGRSIQSGQRLSHMPRPSGP